MRNIDNDSPDACRVGTGVGAAASTPYFHTTGIADGLLLKSPRYEHMASIRIRHSRSGQPMAPRTHAFGCGQQGMLAFGVRGGRPKCASA
jgi:hypothetical protein